MLSGTEARLVAEALEDGDTLSSAFSVLASDRRSAATALVAAAGMKFSLDGLAQVLRAVEGARSTTTRIDTLWTMPGHLAQAGALTTSLVSMVEGARTSVVCSTYNFQKSSGMWTALRDAALRTGVSVRVYVDTAASAGDATPTVEDLAEWLAPAVLLRTATFDGKPVRNHAKFLSVDHRWVVITSANFSWSAEYGNVELGVRIDDPNLADRVEREMREAETALYSAVAIG